MKSYDAMQFHDISEKLVEILCTKTQNHDPQFFRVLVAYYLCKMASMMRVNIKTLDRGCIPVNMYAMNLAQSGHGKGYSTSIMEEEVIAGFRERFLNETFEEVAEENIAKLSLKRAHKANTQADDELVRTQREFASLGPMVFSFDSGTTPAVKQMRYKLLMAGAGSVNLEIDEIGSNLIGNSEVLTAFLELYDLGKIKQKLTKNTNDNARGEDLDGRTPTNMMLFGTPTDLLDGSKTEEEFFSMLKTGYARRCFFGFSNESTKNLNLTAQEVFDMLTDNTKNNYLVQIADEFSDLADPLHFNKNLNISKDTTLVLIEYKLDCERKAAALGEHEEIRKAELSHRYFKALKLAGAYAFAEGAIEVTEDHLYNAIKLAEDSGKSFEKLLTREPPYVKLAKYISSRGIELTHTDLMEALPFYKGSASQRNEMMHLATAYGYKNNIIIKKSFFSGIEILRGESLKVTNLNELIISHSKDLAYNYSNDKGKFASLSKLTQMPNYNWCSHHFVDGHRSDDSATEGFNLVVVDVDGSITMAAAMKLLEGYSAHFYTTKSSGATNDRFRVIFPTSHVLKLDTKDYKEFMNNIYEWLPFDVDTSTNDRCRKWATNPGVFETVEGELLDILPFIPKTERNEIRKKQMLDLQSLSNLERWFAFRMNEGSRNNEMIKYALCLVDHGQTFDQVESLVLALNDKIPEPLDKDEILSTIMRSVAKAIAKQ